jgi:hypothetical protein
MDRGNAVQERQPCDRGGEVCERSLRAERRASVGEDEDERIAAEHMKGLQQLHRVVPVETERARLEPVNQEAQ